MISKPIYEFGSFDKSGNLNGKYVVGMLLFIFFTSFLILLMIKNILELHSLDYKIILPNLLNELKGLIQIYKSNEFIGVINEYKTYFIIGVFLDFYYFYYVINKKLEQRKLSNYGLENYYLKKKLKDGYIYEVVPGERMDYDKFLKQFNNMTQRNKMGSCEIKRFDKVGVMVRFKNPTPTIEDLKKLNPKDFMKKDFLFLGFSGGFKHKKIPQYLNFKDLPHSFALLGTSGGGKSNTLNHILFSVLYNFQKIQELNFIDFKGGVESQPYQNLEDKVKTGKIFTYTERIELYKKLVRLDILNKSRQILLKKYNKKKLTSNFIYIFFDEISEILDYKTNTKEDKFIQDKTKEIIESLFRTSRSSGFKLFYSTQIFTSVGSGISNSIKNNTIFRILHKTESDEGIHSVIDKEPLEERGINVKEFGIGEMIIKFESEYFNVRTLFIPDNFIKFIKINSSKINSKYKKEESSFIKETINNYPFEDKIYSLEECLKDFKL
jgi:DNA segregation ATPase FtsK/SpoIIIE, S-DNA-T family